MWKDDEVYVDQKVLTNVSRLKKLSNYQYDNYPYNCIGVIVSTYQGNKSVATGCLISSCLVLTSAHTFYYLQNNKIRVFKPQVFQMSTYGLLNDQQSIKVTNYKISQKYMSLIKKIKDLFDQRQQIINQNSLPQDQLKQRVKKIMEQVIKLTIQTQVHDYALLKIQKIVQRENYFNLQIPQTKNELSVTVCGYIQKLSSFYLFQNSNKLFIENKAGFYDIDTESGQSGSPVFLNSDKSKVIGIHKGFFRNKKLNSCCLVSNQMIKQLLQWQKKYNLENFRFDNKNKDKILEELCKKQNDLRNENQKLKAQKEKLSQLLEKKSLQLQKISKDLLQLKAQNYRLSQLKDKYFAQKTQLQQKIANQQKIYEGKLNQALQIIQKLNQKSELFKTQTKLQQVVQSQIIKCNTFSSLIQKKQSDTILGVIQKTRLKIVEKTYSKLLQYLSQIQEQDLSAVRELQITTGCINMLIKMQQYSKLVQLTIDLQFVNHQLCSLQFFAHAGGTTKIMRRCKITIIKNDIICLAKLLASFKNLKTLQFKFRHGLTSWSCFNELANHLNQMNLDEIKLIIDKNFQQYSNKINWTHSLVAKKQIIYCKWVEDK